MAYLDFAVDLGSQFTSIYEKGKGIKLRQPSLVVVQNGLISRNIVAFGSDCYDYYGREGDKLSIVKPISDGGITNVEIASKMLEYFLSSVLKNSLFHPSIRITLAVPVGMDELDKRNFETVCFNAGAKQVDFISSGICCAFGMQANMSNTKSVLVCDIGSTTTDISVVNLSGVVTGCTISVGGDNINSAMISRLLSENSLNTNYNTVEKAKIKIASLYPNDTTSASVSGIDSVSFENRSVVVSSTDITDIITNSYTVIIDVIRDVLKMLGDVAHKEVAEAGIYLCGGACKIAGLPNAIYERTKIQVNVSEEPELACILGAGTLIGEPKILGGLILNK